MRLARSVQDPYLLSIAHACLGVTVYWLGELVSVRTHLEQAIALYDLRSILAIPLIWLIRGWIASPMSPGPCGIWAIQSRL